MGGDETHRVHPERPGQGKFSTQASCSHRGNGVLFTHEHTGHLSNLGVSERCTARHPGQGGGEIPSALTEECAGCGPATPQTVSAFVSTWGARRLPPHTGQ